MQWSKNLLQNAVKRTFRTFTGGPLDLKLLSKSYFVTIVDIAKFNTSFPCAFLSRQSTDINFHVGTIFSPLTYTVQTLHGNQRLLFLKMQIADGSLLIWAVTVSWFSSIIYSLRFWSCLKQGLELIRVTRSLFLDCWDLIAAAHRVAALKRFYWGLGLQWYWAKLATKAVWSLGTREQAMEANSWVTLGGQSC